MRDLSKMLFYRFRTFCFSESGRKCRDGATSDFGMDWFTDGYIIWCGLLAKKLPKIHAGNKWYLIINVL